VGTAPLADLLELVEAKEKEWERGVAEAEQAEAEVAEAEAEGEVAMSSGTAAMCSDRRISGSSPRNPDGEKKPSVDGSASIGDTSSAGRIQSLLQQQKDNTQAQVEAELSSQRVLEGELAELTGVLKDVTQSINRTVMDQNATLDAIQTAVEDNAEEVAAQKDKVSSVTVLCCAVTIEQCMSSQS